MQKREKCNIKPEHDAKPMGFTLIELVMVLILLGILASVALPRFLDITQEAHNAAVSSTAGAMSSAIYIAHAKWLASGQPTSNQPIAGIDFLNTGNANVGFSENGWPNAASKGDKDIDEMDVLGSSGAQNNQICAQIMKNILSQTSITIGVGENCDSAYCAIYQNTQCVYFYEKNKRVQRKISYSPTTGEITKQLPK